jgi:cobalt/nickel transport protein
MKKIKQRMAVAVVFLTMILAVWQVAEAHFGMIIPSDEMVEKGDRPIVDLQLRFWHPFEGQGMELLRPAEFGVVANGIRKDLLGTLTAQKIKGHTTWEASYRVKRPGLYVFYMVPQPYFEKAENSYIIHYTKTVMAAYGEDVGWDKPIGLKTEIVPLSRPFGLYAGNVFQGVVMLNGKPVPNCMVEVEYFNEESKYSAPTDYMVTQTIKADANGVFTCGVPMAGWWGFAALNTDEHQIEGRDVEIGAVLWVNFHQMKSP